MNSKRRNELMSETYDTMAGWLWHLIDKNGEENEVSPHFMEEMEFNDMTNEEALFCQNMVKGQIEGFKILAKRIDK